VAIDGLNVCREKSYTDTHFDYSGYYRARMRRYGKDEKAQLRPALVEPLLTLLHALVARGAEPTVFLPVFALDPSNEDCIHGYQAIEELVNAQVGPSIVPVGRARSEDDVTLLAWAVERDLTVVSNDRYKEHGVDPTFIERRVKRFRFVRNEAVFPDGLA
tara:strand:- start:71 stop:550 length:480 start_codon:yes stop_codon:yes gene_type:complete